MKEFSVLQMEEIAACENQVIAVRGFLSANSEGWILSDEPGLKSCCVGKKKNQLRVSGELNTTAHLATIQGTLVVEREKSIPYSLVEASLVTPQTSYILPGAAVLVLCAFLVKACCFRR